MKTATERNKLRRKAYELHASGVSAYGIHKALGVSVQTASNWIKRFAEKGEAGIGEQKRGPAFSPHAALSPDDRQSVSRIMDMVRSFGIGADALNDTRIFRQLLKRFFDVDIPPRSARRWMHRFGLAPGFPAGDADIPQAAGSM